MAVYSERLTPSPSYWGLPLLAAAFAAAALAPVDVGLALAAALLAGAAAAYALSRSAVTVAVADGELRAGRAHVPVRLLGRLDELGPEEYRDALGPGLDARAFVCTRPWVKTFLRAELHDPQDPTPYWLVATRHPAALARALAAARHGGDGGGQAAHSEQTS